MSQKKVLILGGSTWQLGIIQRALDLGLKTLVADISESAPGRQLAHEFIQIDTNDKVQLAAIARNKGVDAVIAEQMDRVVPVAAYINQRLGLHGILPEIALRFTNKHVMRNCLAGTDIPMPKYSEIDSLDDARACIEQWGGYPVVLKPKNLNASLGVFKVDNLKDLHKFYGQTKSITGNEKILLEEFIDGVEITVEGFSANGKCQVLAVSEKEHYPHNECVASRLAYPPRFSKEVIDRIVKNGEKVVETLGLQDGISHAEYRVKDGIPFLVEVNARGGGNMIAPMIVPHVSGVDVYKMWIGALLGEEINLPDLMHRSAVLEFFQFDPGKVKAIHGVDLVKEQGLAQDILLNFKPGDVIEKAQDDRTRAGYFIVLGETRDDTDYRSLKIKEMVKLEYDKVPV